MAFDDEVVEVGGLRGVKGRETKVVEGEEIHANELAQLLVVTSVEARGLEALKEPVASLEVHARAAATRHVTERRR